MSLRSSDQYAGQPIISAASCTTNCARSRGELPRDLRGDERASETSLKGVLGYTDEEVVSTDLRGESCTCVFDARAGIQQDPTFVKLIAWYDNEWGYSSKLLDLAVRIAAWPLSASRMA